MSAMPDSVPRVMPETVFGKLVGIQKAFDPGVDHARLYTGLHGGFSDPNGFSHDLPGAILQLRWRPDGESPAGVSEIKLGRREQIQNVEIAAKNAPRRGWTALLDSAVAASEVGHKGDR